MPEPTTLIGVGALAAYLSKDGLQKLLGPTADYLGAGLKELTQKRMEAIGQIFRNASYKVDGEAKKDQAVPPKVLKHIIEDGSFADDGVEIEYLGGVLASSRSGVSRDNRGASIASVVTSLSNYQLRLHYLLYATVKHIFNHLPDDFSPDGRERMTLVIPLQELADAMDFVEEEKNEFERIFQHSVFGLNQATLIESNFLYGPSEFLHARAPGLRVPGFIFTPSIQGIELFLWAFGKGRQPTAAFLDKNFAAETQGVPLFIEGSAACSTYKQSR